MTAEKKSQAKSASASRSIASLDVALLWGRARAMCSYCRCELIVEATDADRVSLIGEMAHIVGHSDQGPRPDGAFPSEQRNKYGRIRKSCG